MPEYTFTTDIAESRVRARQKTKEEPVTGSHGIDILADRAEHADDLADFLGS